ncbi:hypothetical protein LRL17_03910 [Rhodococcus qingshengii]|uniref:hypothetical protein n=1 Tax=Rhodococcus qingshengii TaxID=334542 RepID=UPI001E5E4875|nr:hypothetical protein [Rhodococcus qingshengii]UGQ52887.1 hypothetical protein LRL17_03910 [Rhodococcus qingshengii]
MKRFLLALAIPAALVLSGCSSSGPEYAASGDETSPSVATSLDAARVLNLDMTPSMSESVRARVVEPTSEPTATASQAESLPGESQICRDILTGMSEFSGLSGTEWTDALTSLLDYTKSTPEWSALSSVEQSRLERAYANAADGEC